MIKVYSATWCPHCDKTVRYLKENGYEYIVFDIEKEPEEIVKKIIEVNGGDDWVVPTLEYFGKWRPGKVFNSDQLKKDLDDMGVKPKV